MKLSKRKPSFSCCNCSSTEYSLLFNVKRNINSGYFLIQCNKCLLIITYPVPQTETLYKTHYKFYRSQVGGQRFTFALDYVMKLWRYLRAYRIANLARKLPVIDIGCGQGIELQILKTKSIPVYGHEYNKQYAKSLEKLTGIKISSGNFSQKSFPKNYFQVISFLHSLEHIPDVLSLLKQVRNNLKKSGYLLISVPNIESLEAKIFGNHWFHLDIPRHLFHFSEDFLTVYVEKLGFKKIWQKHIAPEYDFFSLLQSSLNMIFPDNQNLFYRILLQEQKKSSTNYQKLIPQLPFIMLLIPPALIATPIFWIINGSGTVEMIFRKI